MDKSTVRGGDRSPYCSTPYKAKRDGGRTLRGKEGLNSVAKIEGI